LLVLEKLDGTLVWGILGIFALMFVGVTIVTLWFVYSSSKVESRKELTKRKMDIIDRHFNEMVRIECPYCRTIYTSKEPECPNCRASTQKILFPEIPE